MYQKIIAQGAEAKIIYTGRFIIKHRISKGYRYPILDKKIIKSRTKSESKLLTKASEIINCPKPFFIPAADFTKIKMPFIKGDILSETLNSYLEKKQLAIMKKLGKQVAKLHKNNIIHGDLTTSNIILKGEKIYIIDFGLGFISLRIEDKAVDLHLIKQALEAKHFYNWEKLFETFLSGYQYKETDKVLEQLEKVEARGRYK